MVGVTSTGARRGSGASPAPASSTVIATPRSRELRHREPRIPAGVDVGKGREIHRDVHRQAVIRAASRYAQAEGGDLCLDPGARNVDARGRWLAVCGNIHGIKPFYHRELRSARTMARTPSLRAPQVAEHIDDQLPGAVVGDLPATIDLERGNAVVAQQVLAPTGETERVDRRMLGQPDLVRRVVRARRGERLHRAPRGLVVGPPECTDEWQLRADPIAPEWLALLRRTSAIGHHSTIATIGCEVRSR